MADVARRRQLVQNDIENFDSCLTFDVNEYCIENWPTLTYKNRQAVWSSLQNDEDFDWESVTIQIDNFIAAEASTNSRFVIPDTDDETDDEDSSEYADLQNSLYDYIFAGWDDMDQYAEEEIEELLECLITTIDEAVDEYCTDETIDQPIDD